MTGTRDVGVQMLRTVSQAVQPLSPTSCPAWPPISSDRTSSPCTCSQKTGNPLFDTVPAPTCLFHHTVAEVLDANSDTVRFQPAKLFFLIVYPYYPILLQFSRLASNLISSCVVESIISTAATALVDSSTVGKRSGPINQRRLVCDVLVVAWGPHRHSDCVHS